MKPTGKESAWELYDLSAGHTETTNRATHKQEKLCELAALREEYLREYDARASVPHRPPRRRNKIRCGRLPLLRDLCGFNDNAHRRDNLTQESQLQVWHLGVRRLVHKVVGEPGARFEIEINDVVPDCLER